MKVYGRDIKSQDDDSKLLKSLQDTGNKTHFSRLQGRKYQKYNTLLLAFHRIKLLLRVVTVC